QPDDFPACYVERDVLDDGACLVALAKVRCRKLAQVHLAGGEGDGVSLRGGAFGSDVALASLAGAAPSPFAGALSVNGESDFGWKTPRTRSPGPSTPGASGRPSALKIPVAL